MKLGVLSDVHANLEALDAVLADGEAAGVTHWWALGDLVPIGPDPVPVLERLASLPSVDVTRGNGERHVLDGDRPPPHEDDVRRDPSLLGLFATIEGSFSWSRGAVEVTGWVPWLRALPLEVRCTLPDGTTVLGVHASPGRDDGPGITPHRPAEELRADLEGGATDVVIGGHTHLCTDRRVGEVHALNGGSVGIPITDDLRATYLVLHADRHGHGVEHRRVSYDVDAFLDRVSRSGHPSADYIASHHRGERVQHPSRIEGAPRWHD